MYSTWLDRGIGCFEKFTSDVHHGLQLNVSKLGLSRWIAGRLTMYEQNSPIVRTGI